MFAPMFPFGRGSGRRVITLTLHGSRKRTDIKDIAVNAVSDCEDYRLIELYGSCISVTESHTEILKLLGWDKIIKDDIQHEKDKKRSEKERIEREKMYKEREKKIKMDREAREKKDKKKNKIRSG